LDAQDGGMAVEMIIDGLGCKPQSRVVDIRKYNNAKYKRGKQSSIPKGQ
jgi:hypothetical protein